MVTAIRVLVTQKCRLVTGLTLRRSARVAVLVTQKCRLVTGAACNVLTPLLVLVTQKCRLEKLNGRSICIGIAFAG